MRDRLSLSAFFVSSALILASAFFYFPKWKQSGTEATLSWDVSGYYFYLPAFLIYHDAKGLGFRDSIFQQYQPASGFQQASLHPSGHFVMKYACGQAIQYLPWFAVAHLLAKPLGYPADGFSPPYQAAISWGSLLVALLGLWFLRRSLLRYFPDGTVAVVLICLVFGTNYLNYTAFDGALTHNWLFTAYSLLIFSTIRFYEKPSRAWAAAIGLLVGWATLTRPTEIISMLIPLLWGLSSVWPRLLFFKNNLGKLALAAVVCGSVIFLQLAYWKYATGEWLVYTYNEQTFDWRSPNFTNGLFSYRAGWLVYSPMMVFAVLGVLPLRRRLPGVFPAVLLFCATFMYVTWAWNIWWYGGSLGQRAMVQSYPVWAFPMAALVDWLRRRSWGAWLLAPVAGLFVWHNLWWTHEAHRGKGYYVSEQMSKAFFWKAIGRSGPIDRDLYKYLDSKDVYSGAARDFRLVYENDFENDSLNVSTESPIAGAKSLLLNQETQFSPAYVLPLLRPGNMAPTLWLRASATFRCAPKEWEWWRMTQFVVRFTDGDKTVKENIVRLQRHVDGGEEKTLYFDTRVPTKPFDKVVVYFWNADSDKSIRIDNLKVERFE